MGCIHQMMVLCCSSIGVIMYFVPSLIVEHASEQALQYSTWCPQLGEETRAPTW